MNLIVFMYIYIKEYQYIHYKNIDISLSNNEYFLQLINFQFNCNFIKKIAIISKPLKLICQENAGKFSTCNYIKFD